jgi:hypothetical protein
MTLPRFAWSTRLLLALLLQDPTGAQSQKGIGSRLDRQFTGYASQPTTASEAKAAGWHPFSGSVCHDDVGTAWLFNANNKPGDFDRQHPVILSFSAHGQLSAISVGYVFDSRLPAWAERMVALEYLIRGGSIADDSVYTITVGTRGKTPSGLCDDTEVFPELLGTQLQINPGRNGQLIPLSNHTATVAGYHRGSCFNGMGWHYFKDLRAAPGGMTWDAANLMPVVPMYDPVNGNINAIFFASAVVQQSLFPPNDNEWEPIPLPNSLMCGNFCDKASCTFNGTSAWSTMHFYFNDHNDAALRCTQSPEIQSCLLGIECCPN